MPSARTGKPTFTELNSNHIWVGSGPQPRLPERRAGADPAVVAYGALAAGHHGTASGGSPDSGYYCFQICFSSPFRLETTGASPVPWD